MSSLGNLAVTWVMKPAEKCRKTMKTVKLTYTTHQLLNLNDVSYQESTHTCVFAQEILAEAPVILWPDSSFPHYFEQKNTTKAHCLQLNHPRRTYDM